MKRHEKTVMLDELRVASLQRSFMQPQHPTVGCLSVFMSTWRRESISMKHLARTAVVKCFIVLLTRQKKAGRCRHVAYAC